MKPDWKDAPEWAQYLAMDEDSEWCWFECEPFIKYGRWLWSEGRCAPARPAFGGCVNWDKSLEARP